MDKEFEELKMRVDAMGETLNNTVESLQGIMDAVVAILNQNKELVNDVGTLNILLPNIRYELGDPRLKRHVFPKFYSFEETIRKICDEGASLARFGDGEFATMRCEERYGFQRIDESLSNRLKEVIRSDKDGLLIGIADNFGCLDKYNQFAKDGIRRYMTEEIRDFLDDYLDENRLYADAYMTRFYAMYEDNNGAGPISRLNQLKKMWNKRNVIMVEGAQTRLGVGNDLFDNATSIRRILVPVHNAFDRYEEIITACKKEANDGDLIIVAMGPSAAVLVNDLFEDGIQALDVGHVDIEYEYLRVGMGKRCAVPHKYNGEVEGGTQVEEINDPWYESQIVADCS